jgi:menaquinone-dependent protoporphyrinogen oxidase
VVRAVRTRVLPLPHIKDMKKPVAILYSSWHGQAQKIAQRIADVVAMHGVKTTVNDVRDRAASALDSDSHSGVIVIASVHFGRHPGPLYNFVSCMLTTLSRLPSAFVSVSGAAANLEGNVNAQGYIRKFVTATEWQPDMSLSVAGAVPYTRYGLVTRVLMKFASRIGGRDSDTSRDFEYTDWFAVENFVREFLAESGIGKAA